jgi:hypothetical protein
MSRDECIEAELTPFSEEFFDVWRKHGWTCGIDFRRADGMHFQMDKLS